MDNNWMAVGQRGSAWNAELPPRRRREQAPRVAVAREKRGGKWRHRFTR
jgi:hypothetical protein